MRRLRVNYRTSRDTLAGQGRHHEETYRRNPRIQLRTQDESVIVAAVALLTAVGVSVWMGRRPRDSVVDHQQVIHTLRKIAEQSGNAGEQETAGARRPAELDPPAIPALRAEAPLRSTPNPPSTADVANAPKPKIPEALTFTPERPNGRRLKGWASAAVVVVAAIGVIAFAVLRQPASTHASARGPARPPSSAPTPRPRTFAPTSVASTSTTSTTSVRTNLQPVLTASGNALVSVSFPITLALATTGRCWVWASAQSGETLYEGTLEAGQHQQIVATGPLVLRLGDTSGITVFVDNAPLPLTGIARTADLAVLRT